MQTVVLGVAPDLVDYEQAWAEQRRAHGAVVVGTLPDQLLLVEHTPVFTAGRRTQPTDRPLPGVDPGAPVVDVDRGGRITWHGPGQLTGYPIQRLPDPIDVVAHVRRLEELVLAVCATFGVAGRRIDGRSGVWVGDENAPARKVAAVGVRVARRVTMHGFAINADCDLTWFDRIVPCGISDASVTSLTVEAQRHVTVREVLDEVRRHEHLLLPTAT